MKQKYKDFTLLEDGKEAFPEIIDCINNAKDSIKVNMFIWRDDNIGNVIATCLLNAANRGVKVTLDVDRYGIILEKAEEGKTSFFHKDIKFHEMINSKALELIYKNTKTGKVKEFKSDLYNKILNHPNIKVSKDKFKADHSKYYIIDDILILGGINIEDKENGSDCKGRVYQDYMVKIKGKEYVDDFLFKLNYGANSTKDYYFGVNSKELNIFEMDNLYLKIINESKEYLLITMAYFTPLKRYIDSILSAYNRGVKVDIMVSKDANFQNDTNLSAIKKILKKSDNKINVYLSNKMLHTKLVMNEDSISFGSTNITKKAFNQLDELNLCIENVKCQFVDSLIDSIKHNYRCAKKIEDYKDIKYNKVLASLERFIV